MSDEEFATATLADLYAQQGHFDKALEIYERLVQKNPDDPELAARFRAAIAQAAVETPNARGDRRGRLERLEALLTRVRRRRRGA